MNDKKIHVYTNDSQHPQLLLKLTGEVKKFVSLTPNRIILRGKGSEKIIETVTIVPNLDVSLNIVKITPLNGKDFTYKLEEVKMFGEKTYRLLVENTKKSIGRYTDKLTFTSDRPDYPVFSIMVSGDIQ